MAERTEGLQSIRRALRLARLVAETQRRGARVTDLASYAGVNVATASRILRGLTEERLLRFDERTRSYRIGPLAYELGLAARGELRIRERCMPLLERIATETRETTYLIARSDTEAVCLANVAGTGSIRAVLFEIGDRLPLGIGAGSLALLAQLGNSEVDEILEENSNLADTFGERASLSALRTAVAETRRLGYAYTHDLWVPGDRNHALITAGVGLAIPKEQTATIQLAVSIAFVTRGGAEEEYTRFAAIMRAAVQEFSGLSSLRKNGRG